MRRDLVVAGGLLALGLLQMIAHLLDLPRLRGLAAATHASPAPKVFTAVGGLETYSTAFYLEWREDQAPQTGWQSRRITPELYARLRGPYNRRNVYGAVLAFGPVLATNAATAPMFRSVLERAMCDGQVLRELGLDPSRMRERRVRLEPLRPEALGSLPRVFEVRCP